MAKKRGKRWKIIRESLWILKNVVILQRVSPTRHAPPELRQVLIEATVGRL